MPVHGQPIPTEFRGKAYVQEGCPYSCKFLVFMAEAGLLKHIEIVRVQPDDPSFEATKSMLTERLGKPASFPVVEVVPEGYQSDSDALIAYFAEARGIDRAALPVLSFYEDTILPRLVELHEARE